MDTYRGFTIVELLIVIVVIAILAALSVVGYTNIQQRVKNTTKVSTVQQSIKLHQHIEICRPIEALHCIDGAS
jgi:prepilin-type N-terminal cleavage/methylation domain-containing protein